MISGVFAYGCVTKPAFESDHQKEALEYLKVKEVSIRYLMSVNAEIRIG